ncbi:hypothetical protein [Dactylosporangium sp. NPDC048998]|uniref:hypothetical protein n=1 Tax=Dactylosporangium sp. NPDC048998 TaxID=3363976 RepID=UPI003723D3E9
MAAAIVVVALLVSTCVTLIVLHTVAIRRRGSAGDGSRLRFAVWLLATAAHRRYRAERRATRALLAGRLDRAEYRAQVAAMAEREDAERPLDVPRMRR